MVDDTRLELVTSRTSSGCATSCANRPYSFVSALLVYYTDGRMSREISPIFEKSAIIITITAQIRGDGDIPMFELIGFLHGG